MKLNETKGIWKKAENKMKWKKVKEAERGALELNRVYVQTPQKWPGPLQMTFLEILFNENI